MQYPFLKTKQNLLIKKKVFIPTATSELLIEASQKIIKIKTKKLVLLIKKGIKYLMNNQKKFNNHNDY